MTKLGDKASLIIRKAVADGFYQCDSAADRRSAILLNGRRMLDRDKKDADRFYPNDRAREHVAALAQLGEDGKIAVANIVPIESADTSDLAEVAGQAGAGIAAMQSRIAAAHGLLADGDIMAARQLGEAIYVQSKAGGQFLKRFPLGDSLEACRRIQGDAASIVIKAKIKIYEGWKEAEEEGKTHKGRPKSVGNENAFTAEEAGLTRQDIFEGRKWKEAEEKQPGIVQKAIAARIAAGLEPSKRSLAAAIGTKTATKEERGLNLYETGPEAVHTILALETFTATVWEPACGRGAISRMLEDADYGVVLSDIVDYGTCDRHGELQAKRDFLETEGDPDSASSFDIVTNPPYGDNLNAFVAHALRVHRPRKMALLLNVNFYGGTEDDDRNLVLDEMKPARIYWFSRRLPMMHRDGWDGPKAGSSMNTAWFVWELQEDGTYGDTTVISRVDWEKFMPQAVAAESEAA